MDGWEVGVARLGPTVVPAFQKACLPASRQASIGIIGICYLLLGLHGLPGRQLESYESFQVLPGRHN